jgi:hypothetical protein
MVNSSVPGNLAGSRSAPIAAIILAASLIRKRRKSRNFAARQANVRGAGVLVASKIAAYTRAMTKLAVLFAALVITALCAVVALYAMKIFLFVLLHWQAMVALSLLFSASIFLAALRQKHRAKREL